MNKKEVIYSSGGISLILKDITDLIENQITTDIKEIVINTSSQPNSNPHLGTLTTLICSFAIASRIKNKFKIPVVVEFDELENSPYEEKIIDNVLYTKSLGDCEENNRRISDKYMDNYIFIFDKLKKITNIPYQIRTYKEFQELPNIRQAVIDIYKDYNYFSKLLDPSENKLMLRTKCPKCMYSNRNNKEFGFEIIDDEIYLKSKCFKHGEYIIKITKDNKSYIDINTQLRDLTKGIHIAKEKIENDKLTIMCDGKDWSGEWASRIHYSGMNRLGYLDITNRFFTPLITDWSGGKYSKSVYIKGNKYIGLEKKFANFNTFYEIYGDKGFNIIYKEVEKWVEDPIKFFRNYSIEYFENLLEDKI